MPRYKHFVKMVTTRPTRRGSHGAAQTQIATVFIPYDASGREPLADRYTLLCSHGNAVDLGLMLPMYK